MSRQSELAQLGRVFDTGPLSNRNLIINGAMQVAQRGTSATGVTTSGYKALDRFDIDLSSAGTWTISQDTNTPSGFGSSMKFLCTSADASLGSSDRIAFRQKLEGYNLQGIKKGTSDAQSVAVSFYVKSNKTGTYILEFYDLDNSRHINKAYTVNTADTWEYKTITFDADTTGSFGNDPNASAQLHFWLGAGSNYTSGTLQTSWGAAVAANRAVGNVNLADAASNYWQITGVQLEVGDTATGFEHRSYGDELQRCRRYFEVTAENMEIFPTSGACYTSSAAYGSWPFQVEKRVNPTIGRWQGAASDFRLRTNGNDRACTALTLSNSSPYGCRWDATVSGGTIVSGHAAWLSTLNTPTQLYADAEL